MAAGPGKVRWVFIDPSPRKPAGYSTFSGSGIKVAGKAKRAAGRVIIFISI
jgi:hypothetical protein